MGKFTLTQSSFLFARANATSGIIAHSKRPVTPGKRARANVCEPKEKQNKTKNQKKDFKKKDRLFANPLAWLRTGWANHSVCCFCPADDCVSLCDAERQACSSSSSAVLGKRGLGLRGVHLVHCQRKSKRDSAWNVRLEFRHVWHGMRSATRGPMLGKNTLPRRLQP